MFISKMGVNVSCCMFQMFNKKPIFLNNKMTAPCYSTLYQETYNILIETIFSVTVFVCLFVCIKWQHYNKCFLSNGTIFSTISQCPPPTLFSLLSTLALLRIVFMVRQQTFNSLQRCVCYSNNLMYTNF